MKIEDFPNLFDLTNPTECPADVEIEVFPTGSFYNCNPPATNTDRDYLIYVQDDDITFYEYLEDLGYKTSCGQASSLPKRNGEEDEDNFMSWRKGNINLIVTGSEEFYDKHKTAGLVCRTLNLLEKADRIMVYHAIIYGVFELGDRSAVDAGANIKQPKEIDFFEINKMFG